MTTINRKLDAHAAQTSWLIDPSSVSARRWEIIMLVSLLWTALATPVETAFWDTQLDVLFGINRVVDLVFCNDIMTT